MAATTAAAAPAHTSFRADIDGLRALSILLVVAFHAGMDRFAGGYVGVDVFFVLSGYLITGLLVREQQATGRIGLLDFYARRARRLLPMAGLVLLSTLAMGLALLPPLLRAGLVADVRASALYVANWHYAARATAYSDAEVTDTLLLHYWSLAVEEQFYVLWPLLIILAAWLARRRGEDLFLPLLSALLAIVVVGSLWTSIALSDQLGPSAYYATHTRLWEMGAGAGLAILLPRVPALPRMPAHVLAVVGLTAILGSAMVYDTATSFPGWAALIPVGGTLLLIATAAQGETAVSRFLASGPLPRLGRWSYAWYLWHWPLIGVAALLNSRRDEPWAPDAVTAAAVVLSLALAAASHHLVENPMRHAAFFRVRLSRSLALGVALTLAPVVLATGYSLLGNVGDTPVAAAAAAERTGDEAPMSAADAAEDVVTVAHETCNSTITRFEVDETCVFGSPTGDRTIVLLGDSHAQHWLPALDAAGREEGWRVISWTMSSCPAVDVPVYERRTEGRYVDCEAWRDLVTEQIASRADIDLVVIGRTYNYERLVVDDEGVILEDAQEIRRRWREGASRSFARYTARGADVLVIRETPWSPVDVPTCLSDNVASPEVCDFALDGTTAGLDELLATEEAAADEGVAFWDATPWVCPDDPCAAVSDDGTIIYRDRHHLTQTFSRSLTEPLRTAVQARLDG